MTQVTVDQAMRLAIEHHQSGRLAEAEGIYRQVLAQNPRHPQALHLLGVLAGQAGRAHAAVDLIGWAAEIQPGNAIIQNDLSKFLRDIGQIDAAVATAHRAVQLKEDYAEAQYNYGLALNGSGRREEAIIAFARAVQLKPDFAEGHNNLGAALNELHRFDEAIAAFGNALRLKPDYPRAHNNLAHALHGKGKISEAIAACRRAIQINPDFSEAYGALGVLLREQGDLTEAIIAFRQAISLQPNLPEFHNNLGITLSDMNQIDEAIASLQRAIQIDPNFADAHSNLTFLFLILGDFERGLPEYEWRFQRKPPPGLRIVPQPHWQGEELGGKSILVRSDPCALGDTINYLRYLPLVAARGGRIIFECQPELMRLLKDCSGADQVIAQGQPLPDFDFQCRLLKLLLIFGRDAESIPAGVPLKAEPALVEQWRTQLGPKLGRERVGLVWAGADRQIFKRERVRSTTLSEFAPLANVKGVEFFSLQKGKVGKETSPEGLKLIDFTTELNDFADTAAFVENLDLVVTVDTAMAHLAGAMGKPVWVVLPFVTDWRWQLDRDDSPWYPTMRLFRQKISGDWSSQFHAVAEQLQKL